MRVLHLIDSGFQAHTTFGTAWRPADLEVRACALLQQQIDVAQCTVLLGPAAAVHRARRLGLRVDAAIAPPFGRAELAWRTLSRLIAPLEIDLIQCWSIRTARLAMLASPADRAVVEPPPASAPVFPDSPSPALRSAARKSLGLETGDVAVALLGRGHSADAMQFMSLLCGLSFVGLRAVGIIPGWSRQLGRALRYGSRLKPHLRFIVSDEPACMLLPAADLGVLVGGDDDLPASWFIAEAHACGVPVVSPRSTGLEMCPPQHEHLALARSDAPSELTRVIMRLADDSRARAALGEAAFRHIAEMHPAEHFIRRMRASWNVGAELRMPDVPASAPSAAIA